MNSVKAKWDDKNPPNVPISFKPSEFLVKEPKHKTKTEIQDIFKKEARIKAGLTAVSQVFTTKPIDEMMPSLKYNPNPKYISGSVLKEAKRAEKILVNQKTCALNLNTHKDVISRIKDKEDASFRLREFERDNPTFNDKITKFKQQNLEHYSKNFTTMAIGVHGKELPKFSEDKKDWWTRVKGYNDQPMYQSAKYMYQERNPFKVGFTLN